MRRLICLAALFLFISSLEAQIKIYYKNGYLDNATNEYIHPMIKIKNTGTSSVDLNTIEVRYYFYETRRSVSYFDYQVCYFSAGTINDVQVTFSNYSPAYTQGSKKADKVMNLNFINHRNLAAGAEAIVQVTANTTDWLYFSESDDWSYLSWSYDHEYTQSNNIVVRNKSTNQMIWGLTPGEPATPVVVITAPAEGFITSQSPITVSWTVNGVAQTTAHSENLIEGANTIIRRDTNAIGGIGADTAHGTLDTHAPVVVITAPSEGFITNQTQITVHWTADGVNQTSDTVALLTEGNNTIIRSKSDAAGNIGRDTVHVACDTQAPVVIITSPQNGSITNHSPVVIHWTVDGSAQLSDTLQNLSEGSNSIIRYATDAAGNIGGDTIAVHLDTQAPVVLITAPSDGFTTEQSTITVQWSVDGVTQNTNTDENLSEGLNTIIRSAQDEAGNRGANTVQGTRIVDNGQPLVTIISPTGCFISSSEEVSFTVHRSTALLNHISMFIDGENKTSLFNLQAEEYTATVSITQGHHTFTVYAQHQNGRKDTARISFKVITSPPQTQTTINGSVANGRNYEPIMGVTVQVVETGSSVTSGENGTFSLPSGGFGDYKIRLTHPSFTEAMRFVSVDSGLSVSLSPILLMPLDTNKAHIIALRDTMVRLPNMVEMEIPSTAVGTAIDVSATLLDHIEQLPNSQPGNDVFLFSVDLQPEGVVFADSITIRIPNRNEISPNAEVPITYFNKQTALWDDAGVGFVSTDGAHISFKVKHFSFYHGNAVLVKKVNQPGGNLNGGGGCQRKCCPPTVSVNSEISLLDGTLELDYQVTGGKSLTDIGVQLVYSSNTANPSKTFFLRNDKVLFTPNYHVLKLYLPSMTKEWLFHGATEPFGLSYFWDAKEKNGTKVETGLYIYGFKFSDVMGQGIYPYARSLSSTNYLVWFYKPTMINYFYYDFTPIINRENSPYGSGWSIGNVTRIIQRKNSLSDIFPEKAAFRKMESKDRVICVDCPQKDSIIQNQGVSTALGSTLGNMKGEHVALIDGHSKSTVFWRNDSSTIYHPPYGSHDTLVYTNPGWILRYNSGVIEQFDGKGLLIRRIDNKGNSTRYSYDAFGERLLQITDEYSNRSTDFKYDTKDKLYAIIDQYGRITRITIDDNGDLIAIEDPNGRVARQYEYTQDHYALKEIQPDGGFSHYEYDSFGSIIKSTSPSGRQTTYTRGTDSTKINAFEPVAEGTIESFNLNSGTIPDYTSQPIHLLPKVRNSAYRHSDQFGDQSEYTFNNYSYITAKKDGQGNVTRFSYDNSCNCGSASKTEYPNGLFIENEKDDNGNLLSSRNSLTGATTRYTYIRINGSDYVKTITCIASAEIEYWDSLIGLVYF